MTPRPLYVGIHFYLPTVNARRMTRTAAHAAYMASPKKEELVQDDLTGPTLHARYMTERPGSAGLFGEDPDHPPILEDVMDRISGHTGPVWRFIVSVTESDAKNLGTGEDSLLFRPAWSRAARVAMIQIADELGLSEVEWSAAMHRKAGHPHIHLLFWERAPTRQHGKLSSGECHTVRQVWMRELYGPIRTRLGQEKTAMRSTIRETVREMTSLVPPGDLLSATDQKVLMQHFVAIAETVPPKGRLAMAYLPAPAKDAVRTTTTWILRNVPSMRSMATRYLDCAEELARHHSDDWARHQRARGHAWEDLVDRVSAVVLRSAVQWDREQGRHLRERLRMTPRLGLLGEGDTMGAHQTLRAMMTVSRAEWNAMAQEAVTHIVENEKGALSAPERHRLEAILMELAQRAQSQLTRLASGVTEGLWDGLLADIHEWEQMVRWAKDQMRMRRRGQGREGDR